MARKRRFTIYFVWPSLPFHVRIVVAPGQWYNRQRRVKKSKIQNLS